MDIGGITCFNIGTMPAQPNQSLIDGLRVLQTLVGDSRPVGSREMAHRLDLEHTRVNRLLGTLAVLGLAEQTPDRKYAPGPGIHVLAAQSLQGSNLLGAALPHLERLRAPDLTVALGVRWQGQVCFLYHARPGMRVEEAIGTHQLETVGHSSIGVLLLAQESEPVEQDRAVPGANVGEDSTMPQLPLAQSVAAARKHGYGRLTYPSGDISVAVGVGTPPIAGIAAAGKFAEERIPEIVHRLRAAAEQILVDMRDAVKRR